MKDYIQTTQILSVPQEIVQLSFQVSENTKDIHCGASSKDAGNKITTISKSDNKELYHPMVDDLLLQPALQLL